MKAAKAYIKALPVKALDATAANVAACITRRGPALADSFGKVFLKPLPLRLQEPAYLYLFETIVPDVYKFGISKDPGARAKRSSKREKPLYEKYASSILCKSRQQAICLEQAISELGRIFAPAISKSKDSAKEVIFSTELTTVSPYMFSENVGGLIADWESLDPYDFLNYHCPNSLSSYTETVEMLAAGELLPAISCNDEPRIPRLVEKSFCQPGAYRYSKYMAIEWSKVV